MKLLYVSEHRFVKKRTGDVYTTGQMGESYFSRFKDFFDFVTVIGLCEEENEVNSEKIVEKVNINSEFVKYIFIQTSDSVFGRINAVKKTEKIINELLPLYDRIATKAPSLISYKAVKISKKYKIPLLLEMVGCPWDAFWNHSLKGRFLAPFIWILTRYTVKRAPYSIYVTNVFLQRRYPCKGKSIGCSDVTLPKLEENIINDRISKIQNMKKGRPIIVGTTGAVDVKYKGQEYVIEAISILKQEGYNFEYHLVGAGDESYLKSVAEENGVLDKVKFLGPLPHEKVFDFLNSIDIYIQPSITEGLPRALVEAMSRGCPSIGTAIGGIPELLNSNFLFTKGSVIEICNLLKKMTDKETMVEEAHRSFNKAKEFDKFLLDEKRKGFYKSFIEKGGE